MRIQELPTMDALALAAQADLVLWTVEMLHPPIIVSEAAELPWHELPPDTFRALVQVAFGARALSNEAAGTIALLDAVHGIHQSARQIDPELWRDEYSRLFEGSQACSLDQASYIRRDKGAILGDVCAFYTAFGWRGARRRGERPDHLLCQLEFVAMLLAMAARAEEDEQRQIVHDALAKFARLHMHDWLPSACQHLAETSTLEYFAAVAQWLMRLWEHLTEYHDWPVDPVANAPLPPDTEPDDPYECGAPDLVQLDPQPKLA